MNRVKAVASLFFFVFSFTSIDRASAQEVNCEHPQYSEMGACEEKELAQGEAKMQHVYERLLASFGATRGESPDEKQWSTRMRRRLRESQTAWLNYRQSFCSAVEESYDGGTGAIAAVPGCKADLTEQRAKALQKWLGLWPDGSKRTKLNRR
jgi:uncharacterized protein YecT (DUF1311 family)